MGSFALATRFWSSLGGWSGLRRRHPTRSVGPGDERFVDVLWPFRALIFALNALSIFGSTITSADHDYRR